MILLHAYPLDGSMWEGMDGMPVDHPGSGSLADWADLAASAMREPQAVCGLSMGGYAAFELVRRHPHLVSRLMLADTRAEPDSEEARDARNAAIERVRVEGVAALFEDTYQALLRPSPDPAVVDRVRRIAHVQPPARVIGMLASLRDRADSRDLLPRIAVPTTIVCGSEDAITPPAVARSMAEAIPGARMVEIGGAGHLSLLDQPAAFAAVMRSA